MLAIFKREFVAYFLSPVGYIFMGFFLLLSGFFVATQNFLTGSPQYQGVLGSITFIFLVVVPILTMRLFSEEKRQKTDQLLLTTPTSLFGIVIGKYLAAVAVFLATLLITIIYPVVMSFYGFLGGWEILGGYIGFFLLGCSFIAVGLFVSTLTDNQVIAAVVTFSALLLMWVIDLVQQAVPPGALSGVVFAIVLGAGLTALVFFATRSLIATAIAFVIAAGIIIVIQLTADAFYDTFIIEFLAWFSLLSRYEGFSRGVLSFSPIVYYVSFCGAFVFLTVRMIEKQRWT